MDRSHIISGVSAHEGIQKLKARPSVPEQKTVSVIEDKLWGAGVSSIGVDQGAPCGSWSVEEFELTLPFPPSMNAYWGLRQSKSGARFMVVTKAGTAYQRLVQALVAERWRRPAIDYRIAVLIEAWAPSDQYAEGARWEWDVDNRVKPLQDALAKSGVITNDKLIRDVRIVDRGVDPPGRVVVSIRRFRGY